MAILKIARLGHPVLKRCAEAIADPEAPELARLVEFRLYTRADAHGPRLAGAPGRVPATRGIIRECLANLDRLPATGATLVIGPLRLEGGSGAPASVLALVP